jgi:hypothetical protein
MTVCIVVLVNANFNILTVIIRKIMSPLLASIYKVTYLQNLILTKSLFSRCGNKIKSINLAW